MNKPMRLEWDIADDGAIGETMVALKNAGALEVEAGFYGGGGGTLIGVSCIVTPEARKNVEALLAGWGISIEETDGELYVV